MSDGKHNLIHALFNKCHVVYMSCSYGSDIPLMSPQVVNNAWRTRVEECAGASYSSSRWIVLLSLPHTHYLSVLAQVMIMINIVPFSADECNSRYTFTLKFPVSFCFTMKWINQVWSTHLCLLDVLLNRLSRIIKCHLLPRILNHRLCIRNFRPLKMHIQPS